MVGQRTHIVRALRGPVQYLAQAPAPGRWLPGAGKPLIWIVMGSEHYFSSQPSTPEVRRPLRVTLNGRDVTLATSGGIFSPDGVDKGTQVLLAGIPDPSAEGNLLDIGCGWGPIALTMR